MPCRSPRILSVVPSECVMVHRMSLAMVSLNPRRRPCSLRRPLPRATTYLRPSSASSVILPGTRPSASGSEAFQADEAIATTRPPTSRGSATRSSPSDPVTIRPQRRLRTGGATEGCQAAPEDPVEAMG
ncbi:hypothetical protein ASD81_08385 [Nocardioides sp. Root614]|nr:hypothetical protein ASD81_08385 [Nocardioides sp. Root614]KRA92572.1 hypothetical protein ASD84_08650 [Nocardioides sp. Root682]